MSANGRAWLSGRTRPNTPAELILFGVLRLEEFQSTKRLSRFGSRCANTVCEFKEVVAFRRFPLTIHLTYGHCVALVGACVYPTETITFAFIWGGLWVVRYG
jgi:hypothetical protein